MLACGPHPRPTDPHPQLSARILSQARHVRSSSPPEAGGPCPASWTCEGSVAAGSRMQRLGSTATSVLAHRTRGPLACSGRPPWAREVSPRLLDAGEKLLRRSGDRPRSPSLPPLTVQAWGHALSVLVEVGVVAARARAARVGGVGGGGGGSSCKLAQFCYVECAKGISLSRCPPRNALRMAQASRGIARSKRL